LGDILGFCAGSGILGVDIIYTGWVAVMLMVIREALTRVLR